MKDIICWFSGGVTSAVACYIAIETFGVDACRIIMIDTENESEDTYRFLKDCEVWYQVDIERISAIGGKYENIQDVWHRFGYLNNATGAICSSELKRAVRLDFQRKNKIRYQVFGYHFSGKEFNRGFNLKARYPTANAIFPLLMFGYSKSDCVKIIEKNGVKVPESYSLGFSNNNCLQTGCVRGGVNYWKRYQEVFPDRFRKMAELEHDLTNEHGRPVTVLKDHSKLANYNGMGNVFLVAHPGYSRYKDLSQMKGRKTEEEIICNGFCDQQSLFKDSL